MKKIGWIILQANQVDVASKFFILLLMAIISYGIGSIGSKRKIGFGWAFAFSFFLSPIIGLIIVLCSKKKDVEFIDIDKNNQL